MDIPVNIEMLNEVLTYLGKRPYEEVFQLINKLQSAAMMHMNQQNGQIPEVKPAETAEPTAGTF